MGKKSKIALLSITLFLFSVTIVCAASMSIVTGSTKGTYYQFGLNIEELAKQEGLTLDVVPSNGSVENVYAVFKRPNTQLGIVQADVLAFVARVQTDPVLKRIAKKIKMVFPLYNEEIHVLGQNTLHSFADLQGKKVAVGKEGSGTYLTARLLFEISGIQPAEMLTVGTGDALAGLKNGTIDAMFYVAGYPVKLLASDVQASDNLALLPITNEAITGFYPETTIPANTYSWQQNDVSTVAVKAVLVSYNFRNANCEKVGRVGKLIYDNMEWLKQNGHPKWNMVDLDFPLKGWQQYDCVQKKLGKAQPLPVRAPGEPNPVLEAIKGALQ